MLPLLLAAASAAPVYLQDARGSVSPGPDSTAVTLQRRPGGGARRIGGLPPGLGVGLVGHWSFDEGAGDVAADSSPNGLDGAVEGATWTAGRYGGALSFDGGDWVEIADAPALRITGDISISAWVSKDSPNDGQRWDAIVAKAASNAWDYELLTSQSQSDEPAFYSDQTTPQEVYAGVPLASGVWKHVAVTRAGSTVTFWVDGVVVGSETMEGDFASTSKPLRIGHDFLRGMIGELDEVRLYDRALTPFEVRYLAGKSKRLRFHVALGTLPSPPARGQVEEVHVALPEALPADASVWFAVRPGPAPGDGGDLRIDGRWTRVSGDTIRYRALRRYAGRTFHLQVVVVAAGRIASSEVVELRFAR